MWSLLSAQLFRVVQIYNSSLQYTTDFVGDAASQVWREEEMIGAAPQFLPDRHRLLYSEMNDHKIAKLLSHSAAR
jgi:hypothetical protein